MLPTPKSKAENEHEALQGGADAELPQTALQEPGPPEAAEETLVQIPEDQQPGGEREFDAPRDPLRPIGPERLKALREAIRNGTYPTDEDVLGGLERMLERDDEAGPRDADDAD